MLNRFSSSRRYTNIDFSGDLVLQSKLIPNLGLGDEVNISSGQVY